MDDDIYNFLNKKREEIKENNNFNEWYKDNKLFTEDEEIVIAFHGSRRKIFDKVEEDKLNVNTHLWGGFYMTESLDDASDNYSSEEGADYKAYFDRDVEMLNGGGLDEDDLDGYLPELRNSLSFDVYDKLLEVYSEYDDEQTFSLEEVKEFGIDIDRMESLNEVHDIVEDFEEILNDDFTFDLEALSKMLSLTYKYENDGWVAPFIVKMDKPCFTGFGDEDTFFVISSMDSDEKRAYEEEQAEEHESYDPVMDIKRTLAFEYKILPSKFDEKYEALIEHADYTDVETVFNCYIEVLESFGIDEEKAKESCIEAFNDEASDYITIDEDGDVIDSESIYIPDYAVINGDDTSEEEDLGEEIRNALSMELSNTEFLESLYDERINYDSLLAAAKENLYEDEEQKEFTQAMSTVFDGVVMNAYKANREEWGNAFDLEYNARHYVLFNPNCIKSAIGNNGNYSIHNDNFVERRLQKIKDNSVKALSRDVIEKHVDFINKDWDSDISFELKSADYFTTKNSLASLDKENKTVFINKDNVSSIEDLERSVTHEVVGHLGLNAIFNKDVENVLLRVANKYKEDISELNKEYPEYDVKTKSGKLRLAEEFVAKKAEEKYPDDTLIKKAKTMIKKAFISFKKSLGLKTKVSEDVFELLEDAKEAVSNKQKKRRRLKR